MFVFFYTLPLVCAYSFLVVSFVVWTAFSVKVYDSKSISQKHWAGVNSVVFVAALFLIIYFTIIGRHSAKPEIRWELFAMFRMEKTKSEAWRSLVLNAALFFPLGLSLPNLLFNRFSKGICILITLVFSFLLSAGIEQVQYHFSRGVTEIDDILFNTLGSFIASITIIVADLGRRIRKRQNCKHN